MEPGEALERIGKGTSAVVAGFAAGSALDYALKVVLARSLQPQLYGAFMQAFGIVHVAVIVAVVGLNRGLPRMVSYFRGSGREADARNAVVTATVLTVPPAVLLTVVLRIGAGRLASVFGEPLMVEPLKVLALGLVPMAVFYMSTASLRGMQNARMKVYLDDLMHPSLELLLVLAVFLAGGVTLAGVAYAHLSAALVAALAGLLVVHRHIQVLGGGTRLIPRQLLLFTWPLLVVGVVTAVDRWIDVLMLGWLSTSATAGTYEVAMAVAGVLLIVLSAVRYMFLPVASELYAREQMAVLAEAYQTTARWMMVVVLPLFVGLAVFPAHILTFLFGQGYAGGAGVVRILIAGYMIASLAGPAGMILIAAGRTRLLMWAFLFLGAADIVLNLVLIPALGMAGAAVAMTVARAGSTALILGVVYRMAGMHPFTPRHLRIAAAGAVAAVPMAGVIAVTPETFPAALLSGAVFVAAYLPGVYLLQGVSAEDRDLVAALFRRS
ncbi:MAG: flippase [Candidatus Nanohaloarchaea archaeon]|nr:flippase [Candidatus Nanohaloarchaea archaeon]